MLPRKEENLIYPREKVTFAGSNVPFGCLLLFLPTSDLRDYECREDPMPQVRSTSMATANTVHQDGYSVLPHDHTRNYPTRNGDTV